MWNFKHLLDVEMFLESEVIKESFDYKVDGYKDWINFNNMVNFLIGLKEYIYGDKDFKYENQPKMLITLLINLDDYKNIEEKIVNND